MYGQSTCFAANARLAAIDSAPIVGIADDQPADDQHAVAVQSLVDGRERGVRALARLVPAVLGARLEKRQVLLEDVLDPEEHVPEAGAPHQRGQRSPCGGDRRRHRPARGNRVVSRPARMMASQSASKRAHVERDVVVDQKDRARAARSGVGDVGDDALDRKAVEVASAHLDDRTEAAVERAAARSLDDIDGTAEHRIAARARAPRGSGGRIASPSSARDRTAAGLRRTAAPSRNQTPGDAAERCAALRARGSARET